MKNIYHITKKEKELIDNFIKTYPNGIYGKCDNCNTDTSCWNGCEEVIKAERYFLQNIDKAGLKEVYNLYSEQNKLKTIIDKLQQDLNKVNNEINDIVIISEE